LKLEMGEWYIVTRKCILFSTDAIVRENGSLNNGMSQSTTT